MLNKFTCIFSNQKPIIGMLHLDYLLSSPKYKGLDYVINKAKTDIDSLQKGGIDGILIENWKEESVGEFVSLETAMCFLVIVDRLSKYIKVPFGINVLNNDYKTSFLVAKLTGASFVQMDVFVDNVKSNFSFNKEVAIKPFVIRPNPKKIVEYAKIIGAGKIPLLVFVQPKHYKLIEKNKSIEKSVKQAVKYGASGIIVTKETGVAPTVDLILKAKKVAGDVPVGIGSGFNVGNAKGFLKVADFATVGTSIKVDSITDNPVDENSVKFLMKVSKKNE